MQKSIDKKANNKFSSPRNYYLKSGLSSGNFHSKLKKGIISPENKNALKSFGYRRDSNTNLISSNNKTLQSGAQRPASPKFSNYFAAKNQNLKKASTTTNKNAKKIVFFQKSKKSVDRDSKIISQIDAQKSSGNSSPKLKSRIIDPIKASHTPMINRTEHPHHTKTIISQNSARYKKNFLKEKNSESTKPTDEKSSVQIKWEGHRWPDIQSQLLFGQCIGEGSFAKVYDAFDKILKKAVAVKVIKKKMFKSSKKRKLVQMEIDILSSLDHPNIVKFYRMLEDHKRVKKIFF